MSNMGIAQAWHQVKALKKVMQRIEKYDNCKDVIDKYRELLKEMEKVRYSL